MGYVSVTHMSASRWSWSELLFNCTFPRCSWCSGGAGGDHHAESSPVQNPRLVSEQAERREGWKVQSGRPSPSCWPALFTMLRLLETGSCGFNPVFGFSPSGSDSGSRSWPTVWTTSWEKIWRGWRRSGLTVDSGTSGGKSSIQDQLGLQEVKG